MAGFIKGDILKVRFPFTDFSQFAKRPSFVVKQVSPDDIILCPITKSSGPHNTSIMIETTDFETGFLPHISYIKINYPFTADKSAVIKSIGKLKKKNTNEVIDKLCNYIKS